MNNLNWKHLLLYTILVVLVCFFAGVSIVQCDRIRQKQPTPTVVHKTDTIVKEKRDSVVVNRITVLPGKIDTVFVFNNRTDSLFVSGMAHDTVVIEKLQLKLVTRDTVIHDTITITNYTEKKYSNFGFGLTVGVSGSYGLVHKKFDVGPSVGVGLIYKF